MYKRSNFNSFDTCVSLPSRVFETFEELGYEFNAAGFIRNDFSQLQERENELGYLRALSAMQEYSEQHSNEGKTFEEIIREVRPRWCQLNGEVDRFEQYVIDNALDYYRKLKDKETKEGSVAKETAEGLNIPVSETPATVQS